MKKVALIYNPSSGRRKHRRAEQIAGIAGVFRAAGLEVEACATTHAGSAVLQTRELLAAGHDTIIACGGDGTFNEALNGLMRAGSDAALGVVPLGSGNLLASDLRLPSDPLAAARALLSYRPQEIRPGMLVFQGAAGPEERYFIVAAGVGSDAELMYRTATEAKERFGRNAYFLEMARMALHGRFPMFEVEWEDQSGARRQERISLAMAIRAEQFPGLLRFVNLGSSLKRNDYCLLLFATGKVRPFLSYFASVATGLNWKVPQVHVVRSAWFRCTSHNGPAIHSQADGELLGTVPVEVKIGEKSFRLLMR